MNYRDQIHAREDLTPRPINVWGLDLFVQPLPLEEQVAFDLETAAINRRNPKWTPAERSNSHIGRVVVRVLVDADGKRVFEDADAEWVVKKSAGPVSRIYNLVQDETVFSEESIQEKVKNSEASPS